MPSIPDNVAAFDGDSTITKILPLPSDDVLITFLAFAAEVVFAEVFFEADAFLVVFAVVPVFFEAADVVFASAVPAFSVEADVFSAVFAVVPVFFEAANVVFAFAVPAFFVEAEVFFAVLVLDVPDAFFFAVSSVESAGTVFLDGEIIITPIHKFDF